MKKSLKGALLSGLLYPGIGQIYLKQYVRGAVFIVAVSAGLAAIVVGAVRQALSILKKIESAGGAIDMDTISKAVNEATAVSDSLVLKLLLLFIIIGWVMGVIDAYRIGRKKDIEAGKA